MSLNLGKVFISHSSIDKTFVDKLAKDISSIGIPIWYDKLEINVGDSIPEKINEGLVDAKYFIIVLSSNSMTSRWVREELNAAIMRQIVSNGTFIIPILLEECNVPPLISHRRAIDFSKNYETGLEEICEYLKKDYGALSMFQNKSIFPWPDLEKSNDEYVYLHSERFDKFFRMDCSFTWSADYMLDYIIKTLNLPYKQEIQQLGMTWSFSYKLIYSDKSIPLSRKLSEFDIKKGAVLKLGISGVYQDLYKKELEAMWQGDKMYEMSGVIIRERELRQAIENRGKLTSTKLKQIANSCFKHI
ncbi:toll/interleukin-1 receptor domain-containing protein [Clostridium beijerinckii]|uniref:toll/interleukin-1 receptor domain-containing protein n=1 Tax=Clostridium beijerinckii TaxID=1520 RepID=UPI00098C8F6B|nr:toll/interleukin-1 receptor domain-containing protein [Clostridium beijerinckii]NRT77623.1 hypothetical protein [Clostridium beijerinckii]OOM50475.1 TIR domain protein [Clostridium beijerinckii]